MKPKTEIFIIGDTVQVDYSGGDFGLAFQFFDSSRTVHNGWINAYAVIDLARKVQEAQFAIMESQTPPEKTLSFSMTEGPEHNEVYGVTGL